MATALLNGTLIDDGGMVCEVRFEYGLSPGYGLTTPWRPGYRTGDTFQERILNLPAGILVYFRTAARNALGTTYGLAVSFTTRPRLPVINTDPATNVSTTGATLNGTVVDGSDVGCVISFEYGGTAALGMKTVRVSGFVTGSTFSINIVGISPGRPCFFRAVADNRYGRGFGNVRSFTTLVEAGPRTGFLMEYAPLVEEG